MRTYRLCAACRWTHRCWATQRFREFRYTCARIFFDRLDADIAVHNADLYMHEKPSRKERLQMSLEWAMPAAVLGWQVAVRGVKTNWVRSPAAFWRGVLTGTIATILALLLLG
jgi:hypothetical protein